MPSTNSKPRNAITLLTEDHAVVKKLLRELKDTTPRGLKKRQELLAKIGVEVRVHARIEEEIFYPAYHAAADTHEEEKLFYEAAEEHALVDIVLPELEASDPSSEVFGAKAKVLFDLIDHHAEEEETEMFPKARKLLMAGELADLGARMQERKLELLQELGMRREITPAHRNLRAAMTAAPEPDSVTESAQVGRRRARTS